jgi:GAF domain-containing protein
VPIALISFVDAERVFFKANHGFKQKYADRGVSLCALAVLDNNVTFFEDARKEPCLMANPLVQGEFGLQFYAGAPLRTKDGYNIGTVCIVDKKQRFFSKEQSQMLEDFAILIMDLIYLRHHKNLAVSL